MPAVKRSINTVANEILTLQNKRKALESQAEEIKKKEKALSEELMAMAQSANLTFGGNKKSAWKIDVMVAPQATDWDEFYAYIKKKDYFHLLQRRPAVKACQELWGLGEVIPGIEKFTSNKVSVKEV